MRTFFSIASFLVLTGIGIPLLAWLSKKKLDEGFVPPRLPFYAEAAAFQLVLLPFALWVANANGVGVRFGANTDLVTVASAAVMLAVSLAIMRFAWRRTKGYRRSRLLAIVPRTGLERVAWVGVSIVAGVCEEVVYRCALPGILLKLGMAWWPAVACSSILFGLAHLVQGWKSSVVVMGFGVLFHLLVRLSGGLGLAIAVHAFYDVLAGLALGADDPDPSAQGASAR